jgi:sulfur-oxidizing protein SoxA
VPSFARSLVAAACLAGAALGAQAQKTGTDGIAEYRAMLADGNPADLFVAKGEDLWKTARGPKKATLEKCDLGLGPGVVKGAWVQLPRWFEDTHRVQDLESRLLTCMETLQGIPAAETIRTPYGKGEQKTMEALVAYVSSESQDMKIAVGRSHPEEQRMYELGRRAFYYRGGPMDFACSTCHGQPDKRIRMQDLPDLRSNPGDGLGFASWPAYRVSSGELWSMQRRLNDCFRQQRFPYPGYASDVTVALGMFMGVNANGAKSTAPALKR